MDAHLKRDKVQAQLASYACSLDYDRLPPDVIQAAKARIVDTLGVLVSGFDGEPCKVTRNLAKELNYPGRSTILGTDWKTSVEMAALVNGTTARYAELTDIYHWPGSAYGHPSDTIAPLFSVAEHAGASGKEFITAVVLSYEVFCRISDAFHNKGFDAVNFGCIATALASARLLKLTPEQTAHALSLAAVPNVILKQVRVDNLTMFKVAAAGHAARAGVFAALMARAGMEGPHLPFEGRYGWCNHVSIEPLSFDVMGGQGSDFKLPVTGIKHRPCAGNTISSVLAAEQIAPLPDTDAVERIVVEVYERAKIASGTGEHFWAPETPGTADHSIPYLVAATLIEGTVTHHSFDKAHLADAKIRALTKKVQVEANDEFTRAYESTPVQHRTRITVTLNDGWTLSGDAGGDENDLSAPCTDAQIDAKFRKLAGSALGEKRLNDSLRTLWALQDVANVDVIARGLVIS
jgi:2-methylcitrate dehydratase